MIKEIKYLIFIIIVFVFIFFIGRYYFSDTNKKRSFRSLKNIDQKIILHSQKIPILQNDTQNIIEYVKNNQANKKKNIHFGI
tara:strand:+ start:271 stop:516 length:246 start_codon:yes stop_codon:yes gene_type:complete